MEVLQRWELILLCPLPVMQSTEALCLSTVMPLQISLQMVLKSGVFEQWRRKCVTTFQLPSERVVPDKEKMALGNSEQHSLLKKIGLAGNSGA